MLGIEVKCAYSGLLEYGAVSAACFPTFRNYQLSRGHSAVF